MVQVDGSAQLTALGDPTRRAIFEHLIRHGPLAVGELAHAFPVSRPAVSQHLKALMAAGLVTASSAGSRRIYSVDPAGISALQMWMDDHWQHILDHFHRAAHHEGAVMPAMPESPTSVPPVQKSCTVPLPPPAAFDLFTSRIREWWPVGTHSISADETAVASVRFEGRVGGRVVEVTTDGREYIWADVLAWNPPHRVMLSWHPAIEPVAASRLEVTFRPVDGGTEVILVHSAWEEFGEQGDELRKDYDTGWDRVLSRYREVAGR